MKDLKSYYLGVLLLFIIFNIGPISQLDSLFNFRLNANINSDNVDSWSTIIKQENYINTPNIKCINNDIYVIGTIDSRYSINIYVAKYNSSGIKLWEQTWGGTNTTWLKGFEFDSEDNLYIVGELYPINYSEEQSFFLLKYTNSGELLWSKTLSNNSNIYSVNYKVNSIKLDLNDFIYIIGVEYHQSVTLNFLIKLNSSGNILWQHKSIMSHFMGSSEIQIDSKNNIYIYGGGFRTKLFLIKYNSSGSIRWYEEWGVNEIPGILKLDSNGDIILSGFQFQQNNFNYDYWIMKRNSSGCIVNMVRLDDLDYYEEKNTWVFEDIYIFNYDTIDRCFLSKYDLNLNYAWNRSLSESFKPFSIYSITIGVDLQKNILLLYNNFRDENNRQVDILILKFNSTGEIISSFYWGGSDNDRPIQVAIDSEDNLYMLCISDYVDVWNVQTSQTILVKNPQSNGKPPHLSFFSFKDVYIISFLSFMILISVIITVLILKPKFKRDNQS